MPPATRKRNAPSRTTRVSRAANRAPVEPDVLGRVRRLAVNLWWTWNSSAQRLFAALDPLAWHATHHNPVAILDGLSPTQREAVARDERILHLLRAVEEQFQTYVRARTWYQRSATAARKRMRVAYFCAEYALHECLPIYAGGLGVLAGDHLKSASDLGVPLTAVGLLYRNGYYTQRLDAAGKTVVRYPQLDFAKLPIHDTGERIAVPFGRGRVFARVWRADVGRVPLLLLDTDIERNPPALRSITRHLYGGDNEMRIQQEILLGVGGMLALDALDIRPTVVHLNEGHAAFAALELLRREVAAGKSHKAAMKVVAARTVFTTHTPVPAGHDRFGCDLMDKYFPALPRQLGVKRDQLLALGQERPDEKSFCMTALALRLSSRRNGVSALNGEVSRAMWAELFAGHGDGRAASEVVQSSALQSVSALPASSHRNEQSEALHYAPIGHVTNGIHPQTWLAPEAEPLYDKYLQPKWAGAGPDDDWWKDADRIPPAELWELRGTLRRKLLHFVRARLALQAEQRGDGPAELATIWRRFDPDALTIGFARRFATYKRAPLIFRDAERLAAILNNPQRPVQLVFAGKAHPRDIEGQKFAQFIDQISHEPRFRERVVLIENYDMEVGRVLTSGCDVWLNTPIRPREASGTSGMKPPLHGGLNCSILDGWWPEAWNGQNGWAIEGENESPTRQTADPMSASNAQNPRASERGPADEVDQHDARAHFSAAEDIAQKPPRAESSISPVATSPNSAAAEDADAVDQRDAEAIYRLLESDIAPLFYSRDGTGIPQGWVERMVNSMQTICAQFSAHRMLANYVRDYYWTYPDSERSRSHRSAL